MFPSRSDVSSVDELLEQIERNAHPEQGRYPRREYLDVLARRILHRAALHVLQASDCFDTDATYTAMQLNSIAGRM